MSDEQMKPTPQDMGVWPDEDDFRNKVEDVAFTVSALHDAASQFFKANPNMTPEDRAKYFRQMAELVAKKLEENKIY